MELTQALNQRRSVRSYTGEVPTAEQLERILTAADEAPVGMGAYDNLRLTVVTNPELLGRIDQTAAHFFGNPDAHPLYGAPLLVVVSSAKQDNVASANVGAVIENMSLAAVDEGVGSCFIYGATAAFANDKAILAELGIPGGFVPLGSLALGQTADAYAPRELPEAHHIGRNTVA